jgi:phosphate transport system substrate-binding protein
MAFLLAVASGCASQPMVVTREPVTLRLVAPESLTRQAEAFSESYHQEHAWVTIQVLDAANSSVAERLLLEGESDLALVGWLDIPADGPAVWKKPFFKDAIAVAVHPSFPLTETGLAFLHEVYRGRVQEWGGVVLIAVSREAGSGIRAAFEDVVMRGADVTQSAVLMPSNGAVVDYVARTPGAIGYASVSEPIEGVRILPVEGSLPSPEALADGSYPIWRSLYIEGQTEPVGGAREFAQWVVGPEGVHTLESLGLGRRGS